MTKLREGEKEFFFKQEHWNKLLNKTRPEIRRKIKKYFNFSETVLIIGPDDESPDKNRQLKLELEDAGEAWMLDKSEIDEMSIEINAAFSLVLRDEKILPEKATVDGKPLDQLIQEERKILEKETLPEESSSGFVYLIRNKDLYKIGITVNLEQRMKQLKPDEIVATLKTEDFESLEKELHKRYKGVRIPQSEYFRLTSDHLIECKKILDSKKESLRGFLSTTKSKLVLVGCIYLSLVTFFILIKMAFAKDRFSFTNIAEDLEAATALTSLGTFFLSITAFFRGSGQYLSTADEVKDRFQRSLIFITIAVGLLLIYTFSSTVLVNLSLISPDSWLYSS